MNTPEGVKVDERTVAVAHAANTWGLNFISIAILIDIMYRSAVLHEAPWDLFALLGASSVISTIYMARHKVLGQVFGWRLAIVVVGTALVAAIAAAVLTMAGVK